MALGSVAYSSFATGEGEAQYRSDLLQSLKDSNAIVMDCDGTLVEIANSYDEAIYSTVEILFQSITARRPKRDALMEATFELRRSGGFNNDWDTAYSILMGLLSGLPDEALEMIVHGLSGRPDRRLTLQSLLGCCARAEGYDEEEVLEGLRDVVSYADEGGASSIERGLERLFSGKAKADLLRQVKCLLKYPGMPSGCLISSIFDELYLGSALYSRVYGLRPSLCVSRGLIENETLIVEKETLAYLKRRFCKGIGLATGRTRIAAEKTLWPLLKSYFRSGNALTFSDDLLQEYERRRSIGLISWPGKPDPFALQRSIGGLPGYTRIIFVGDSMEDLKMCKRVEGYDDTLLFVGVYEHTINPGVTANSFLEGEAAAVLPTVNELKELLGD